MYETVNFRLNFCELRGKFSTGTKCIIFEANFVLLELLFKCYVWMLDVLMTVREQWDGVWRLKNLS